MVFATPTLKCNYLKFSCILGDIIRNVRLIITHIVVFMGLNSWGLFTNPPKEGVYFFEKNTPSAIGKRIIQGNPKSEGEQTETRYDTLMLREPKSLILRLKREKRMIMFKGNGSTNL